MKAEVKEGFWRQTCGEFTARGFKRLPITITSTITITIIFYITASITSNMTTNIAITMCLSFRVLGLSVLELTGSEFKTDMRLFRLSHN